LSIGNDKNTAINEEVDKQGVINVPIDVNFVGNSDKKNSLPNIDKNVSIRLSFGTNKESILLKTNKNQIK
jgi:hypothetical protein